MVPAELRVPTLAVLSATPAALSATLATPVVSVIRAELAKPVERSVEPATRAGDVHRQSG